MAERSPWTARDYSQLQRTEPTEGSRFTTYSYTGGVYYTIDDKYSKITFEEMAEKSLNLDSAESWTAMIQHYFVSAWIPPAEQIEHFYSNSLPGGRVSARKLFAFHNCCCGRDSVI